MAKIRRFEQTVVQDMFIQGTEILVVDDTGFVMNYQGKHNFEELKQKIMTGKKVLLGVDSEKSSCTLPEEMSFC